MLNTDAKEMNFLFNLFNEILKATFDKFRIGFEASQVDKEFQRGEFSTESYGMEFFFNFNDDLSTSKRVERSKFSNNDDIRGMKKTSHII